MFTTTLPSVEELLCKLERYAPHRLSRTPLGTMWDLKLDVGAAYLSQSGNNPIDRSLLIAAAFLEAQHRGWLMGLSNIPGTTEWPTEGFSPAEREQILQSLKPGYFCRIEMTDDSEVSESSDNPAIACLGALVKAFEEQISQAEDFAEWG